MRNGAGLAIFFRSEGPSHSRRGQSEAAPPVPVCAQSRAESASQSLGATRESFGLPVPGEELINDEHRGRRFALPPSTMGLALRAGQPATWEKAFHKTPSR